MVNIRKSYTKSYVGDPMLVLVTSTSFNCRDTNMESVLRAKLYCEYTFNINYCIT